MKKLPLLFLFSLFFATSASAKMEFYCDYKDRFHISSKSHPAIYIANATTDGDVMLQTLGFRSFVIRDTPRCVSGFAHVALVLNETNWCALEINDGPFMWHPIIHASCHGLVFGGMTYDGYGTYSYTIHIE